MATTATPVDPTADENSVLEEAFLRYQESGVRLPPVPRELLDSLDEFADWSWGSADLDLMDLAGFLDAAEQAGGPAEVAFGHTGHGVSSWWLCYRLKLDSLAVFVRQSFGGAYANHEASLSGINEVAERLESLIPAAEAARKAGRFRAGHRLIVVLDGLRGSFWQIAGSGDKQHRTGNPIDAAMDFLSQPVPRDAIMEIPSPPRA